MEIECFSKEELKRTNKIIKNIENRIRKRIKITKLNKEVKDVEGKDKRLP